MRRSSAQVVSGPCSAGRVEPAPNDKLLLWNRVIRIDNVCWKVGAVGLFLGDGNGLPDVLELLDGSAVDCNENNTVDSCDIDNGDSMDNDGNGIPDECECPADFDGSGDVSAADLAELLSNWGPCVGCPADFDGDGVVNAADLAELLAAWGPCE